VKKSKLDAKDTYTSVFLKEAGLDPDAGNLKKYRPLLWFNFRSKSSGGMRLTEEGIRFIENEGIRTYKIDFPVHINITPQLLIWLDQGIDSPYYLEKKSITVIKEKAAFELYLFSGDIRKMGYAKSLSKRFEPEIQSLT
jgi:hypothetical protein